MARIADLFDENVFCIEEIVQERNSPQREFVVRVNNNPYLMSYREMERFCQIHGINLEEELRNSQYRWGTYDNRPLWKKDMDFRMGKPVVFHSRSLHLPDISADRLQALVWNRTTIFTEEQEHMELE